VLKETLARLMEGRNLSLEEARALFSALFAGEATPAQLGAFLVALRMKGETADEIAGAAEVLRQRAVQIRVPDGLPLLDTCGTGGDGAHTFNISTAVALVAAGAGARVAKHGNRSVSSQCGSADVLQAAGVRVDGGPAVTERCLAELGVGFLFAPSLHAGFARVAAARKELGVRSIFNVLGPLANPAGARHQLLGVYSGSLVPTLAQALKRLGAERALVVHGEDGLDEVSPCGPTQAALLHRGEVRELTLRPQDVSLRPVPLESLRGGDAARNAQLLQQLLAGERGPLRDAVILNTAAALWVAELASDLKTGAERAAASLDGGQARAKLEGLIRLTQESVS
jgi:anthranilate phosphoribosyltransferase